MAKPRGFMAKLLILQCLPVAPWLLRRTWQQGLPVVFAQAAYLLPCELGREGANYTGNPLAGLAKTARVTALPSTAA